MWPERDLKLEIVRILCRRRRQPPPPGFEKIKNAREDGGRTVRICKEGEGTVGHRGHREGIWDKSRFN